MKKVTVLIPAYNEADTIVEVLEKVNAVSVAGVGFEKLLIDDGSRDAPTELVSQHRQLFHNLIRLESNRGKGAVIREGLRQAGGVFYEVPISYHGRTYEQGEKIRPPACIIGSYRYAEMGFVPAVAIALA